MPCSLPPGATVIAYARDSGGQSQDRSVGQQLAAIAAYCQQWQLVLLRTWADEAQPGSTTASRDQFLDMVAWLRSLAPEPEARRPRDPTAPDALLYWDVRRFSRQQDDSAYYRADLRRRGYAVVSVSDDIPAGDMAPVFESLLSWKAHQDLTAASRDVKRGLRDLVETRNSDGGYLHAWPGRVPPGFRRVEVQAGTRRDGRARLVQGLAPDIGGSWEQVRRAFELRASGASLSRIHAETGLCARRRGYYTLLHNPLYCGRLEFGGLEVDGWIDPCVPEATWQDVQSLHGKARPRISSYALSGLFSCGECGSPLTGKTNRLRRGDKCYTYRRYACRKARAGWENCDQHRLIDADRLERAVYDVLAERVLRYEVLAPVFAELDLAGDERLAADLARLEGELAEAGRRVGRLVGAVEQGADLPEVVAALQHQRAAQKDITIRIRELALEIEAAHRGPVPEAVVRAFCDEVATVLQLGKPETVKDVLRQVIVEGVAWADGRGELAYRSPWAGMMGRVEFCW